MQAHEVDSAARFSDTAQNMRFLPREESFFDDFEKHAAKTVEGCRAFLEMAESATDCGAVSARVKAIESE